MSDESALDAFLTKYREVARRSKRENRLIFNQVCIRVDDIDAAEHLLSDSGIDPSEQESLAPLETIALRRRGRADEVARVVAWLASDDASYVSGNALLIDGALTEGI